ncbi:lipid-A-disaccharide synthase N-terminal domain-containing protein [Parabacteroides distasonis]|nr:lipid-A-disaccharide synthase N-terminal domain-containing protein [Parabacteroides distasonis]
MMAFDWFTFSIGLLAQFLFSARTLVQWVLSERAKRVVSPSIFWMLGLWGSFLLSMYGCLREDFSIVFGQCVLFYVYWWNLKKQGVWEKIPFVVRMVLCSGSIIFAMLVLCNTPMLTGYFFKNTRLPLWLLFLGTVGQLVFASRFIVQWIYSYYIGRSTLPVVFWIISLIGSSMIFLYGMLRHDMVLLLGHSFGIVVYIRNLYIGQFLEVKGRKA